MPAENTIRNKNERGAALTQKQYNIIVSYLNTGIKPSVKTLNEAGLTGKLNGGVPGPTKTDGHYNWWRFRSIVKRVSLRPTNGDLVYIANGRVILPKSRFIPTIKAEHKGTDLRKKHLNFTQTLVKLQEQYTIGRRQFGICEDLVRDVVRACREGSCAKKRKTSAVLTLLSEESDDLQQPAAETPTSTTNTPASEAQPPPTLPTSVTASGGSRAMSTLPASACVPIPVSLLEKQPDGTFIFKPSQLNSTTSQVFPTTSDQGVTHAQSLGNLLANKNFVLVQARAPGLTFPSMPMLPSIPSQGPMPVMPNIPMLPAQPMRGTAGPMPTMVLPPMQAPLSGGINQFITRLPSADSYGPTSSHMGSNTIHTIPDVPVDHNVTSVKKNLLQSYLETETSPHHRTSKTREFDLEYWRKKWDAGSDDVPITITDSSSDDDVMEIPSPAPFPNIWYHYNDLNRERNPYERIVVAIQDMKVDMMRSFTYDCTAMDKLRKKIQFVEFLVKAQKCETDPFNLFD